MEKIQEPKFETMCFRFLLYLLILHKLFDTDEILFYTHLLRNEATNQIFHKPGTISFCAANINESAFLPDLVEFYLLTREQKH